MREAHFVLFSWLVLPAAALLSGCSGCSQSDLEPSGVPVPTAGDGDAITGGPAPGAPGSGFHCYAWTQGDNGSTDCFRTPTSCETARSAMTRAGRATQPCAERKTAICTIAKRTKPRPSESERCYADVPMCEAYRKKAGNRGFALSPCEER